MPLINKMKLGAPAPEAQEDSMDDFSESKPGSIAEAIMNKRLMSKSMKELDEFEDLDANEPSIEAEDDYSDIDLSLPEEGPKDRVSAILARMKAKRSL